MKMVSLTLRPLYLRGKNGRYLSNRRMDGPRNLPGGLGGIKYPVLAERLSSFILINQLVSLCVTHTHSGLPMCNPALFLYISWIKAFDSLPPLVNCGTFTHLASFRGRAVSTACQATTYTR